MIVSFVLMLFFNSIAKFCSMFTVIDDISTVIPSTDTEKSFKLNCVVLKIAPSKSIKILLGKSSFTTPDLYNGTTPFSNS